VIFRLDQAQLDAVLAAVAKATEQLKRLNDNLEAGRNAASSGQKTS
jgi:hypothetical protein